ncbi:MAG UNVERIFIED_CONTAM: NADH-quinone oxidoreductase subunit I [Anaerolineae bacterium]|jgi:NADH-quinone oxidoreductase subunit I
MNLIKGFATTFKHLWEEPVTVNYPEEMKPFSQRYKGRHHLRRYENGLEKCIGCSSCAAACPADAIWVEAAENTDEERYSPANAMPRRMRSTCCVASSVAIVKMLAPPRQFS